MSIKWVKAKIFDMMKFSAWALDTKREKHAGSGNPDCKNLLNFPQPSFISKAYEKSSRFLTTA